MPFICAFQLNNGAISSTDEVILVEFINSAFDAFYDSPIRIAKVLFNGKESFIYSNCPCYVSSKANIEIGERITDKTIIGYFSANGEDIPYDKPYAVIKEE